MLERIKQAYLLWHEYYSILPKVHRYTVGQRVDTLFIQIIEAIFSAAFLQKEKKLPYVSLAIQKLNTANLLLMILWESKSLRDKKYILLSGKLDEIGKMLGGWAGQILRQAQDKQNSPEHAGEK